MKLALHREIWKKKLLEFQRELSPGRVARSSQSVSKIFLGRFEQPLEERGAI